MRTGTGRTGTPGAPPSDLAADPETAGPAVDLGRHGGTHPSAVDADQPTTYVGRRRGATPLGRNACRPPEGAPTTASMKGVMRSVDRSSKTTTDPAAGGKAAPKPSADRGRPAGALDPTAVVSMQHAVGNGAVQRLLGIEGGGPPTEATTRPVTGVPAADHIQRVRGGPRAKAKAKARAEERGEVDQQRQLDRLIGREGREILEIVTGAGGSAGDLVALVGAAPTASVTALRDLLTAAGPNPPVASVTALVTAAGPGVAITDITGLVSAVDGWTIGQLVSVVTAIGVHHGVVPFAGQVRPLVEAMAEIGTSGEATALLGTVAGTATPTQITALLAGAVGRDPTVTLGQIGGLVTAVGANGTLTDIGTLVTAAGVRDGTSTIAQIAALVTAAGNVPAVCVDLTALVNAVAANGTIVQDTALVAAVRNHRPDATIPDITALATAVGAVVGLATNLTALINAAGPGWSVPDTRAVVTQIGVNGTLPEITALATAALAHAPVTAAQLVALLQAAPQVANLAVDVTALLNAVAAAGTINATARLVTDAVANDPAVTVIQITALVGVNPQPPDLAQLRHLVNAVAGNGTVTETTALLAAVNAQRPETTVSQVRDLVLAAGNVGNVCNDLIALVTALAGRGTILQTRQLVAAVVANGTVPDATALVNAIRVHAPAASAHHIVTLLGAFGAAPNLTVDVAGLVNAVGANGSLPQVITLAAAARGHQPGTTVPQLTALVVAAGNVPNVCVGLLALVNAVAANGTIPESTGLLAAVGLAGTLAEATALVTAIGVNGTVPQTTALIGAAVGHHPGTTVPQITALAQSFAAAAGLSTNLTALVNAIAANSTVPQTTALVTAARVHHAATTVPQMTALVAAAGNVGNVAGDLTTLLNAVAANGTVPQTTGLVTAARGHDGAATLTHITALVNAFVAAPGISTNLTALVNAVAANGTIVETTALVTAARVHNAATTVPQMTALVTAAGNYATLSVHLTTLINTIAVNGTVPQTTLLVTRAIVHNAGTRVLEINALAAAFVAAAALSTNLTALVNAVAARNTVPQTTVLVTAARNHNAATTVPQMTALINAATAPHANVCVDLTALVNAIAANGTIPVTTQLVTQAVATLGAGHTNDLLVPINRNAAQNTPPRLRTLLIGLNPNTRARYLLVEPRIINFLRHAPPPHHGNLNYNAHGYHFTCNRWRYFYRRHTERYFDFGMAAHLNEVWAPGTGMVGEVAASVGGLSAPQAASLGAGGGYWAEMSAGNEIGVNAYGEITHLMPWGNSDFTYAGTEVAAIRDLR